MLWVLFLSLKMFQGFFTLYVLTILFFSFLNFHVLFINLAQSSQNCKTLSKSLRLCYSAPASVTFLRPLSRTHHGILEFIMGLPSDNILGILFTCVGTPTISFPCFLFLGLFLFTIYFPKVS